MRKSKKTESVTAKIREILQDDRIHRKPTGDLRPWTGNARRHSERQLSALTSAIQSFGFTNPILVNEDGVILCGHGRWEAAKRLGMTQVPVIVIAGLSKKEQRAFVIADNKMSDLAGWNMEQLVVELETIIEEGAVEIELTGFTTTELDIMFDEPKKSTVEKADPDDLQERDLNVTAVTVPGDLYEFEGGHRIYCGNSLEAASYKALFGNERAQMVFTDPPYNVPINKHVRVKKGHREFAMASGEMSGNRLTSCILARNFSITGILMPSSSRSFFPLRENGTG